MMIRNDPFPLSKGPVKPGSSSGAGFPEGSGKPPRMRSLKSRFFLFFIFFVVALLVVTTVLSSIETIDIASSIFAQQGVFIVRQAQGLVDGDRFEALAASLDAEDPFYEETRRQLLNLKQNTAAVYLYTMAPVRGTTYRFIIDGSAPPDNEEDFSPLGLEDDVAGYDSAFIKTWQTKEVQAGSLMLQGKWGWLVSVYAPVLNSRGDMVGLIGCDFEARLLFEGLRNEVIRQIILDLILIAAGVLFVQFFLRMIFSRLSRVSGILKEISEGEGDLTTRITVDKLDEIGIMALYFNRALDQIKGLVLTIKEQSVKLFNVGNDLAENMIETASAINQITGNIQGVKAQVINQSAGVTETTSTMEQLSQNIDKLNGQVEDQTESVSRSSAAIEEMLTNVRTVTATLVKNTENVNELTTASELGRSGLGTVSTDIQGIARESEGLMQINAVIQTIAAQTNLLAMNAAIEAAHAGDAGRGFMVVADEIRKLAENAGSQSKTIRDVLKRIKTAIDKIALSANTVLEKFQAIDDSVKTVSDQEVDIRTAMEEQGKGSKQILEAVARLNNVTRNVKQGSTEMRQGSQQVIIESKNLEKVTLEISNGMNEMAAGAEEINAAVNRVNGITVQNREYINTLVEAVTKFKVD
ncbi:MAG: methyl-accepting chemotaxis protein [Treponema sp.]|nr:methyl-accepting chemotaxis protein [Treponema sp.]